MDMTTGTTTTAAAATTIAASVKTPEAKNETPARIQPIKISSFSNGVLKRTHLLHPHHHYHPGFANHHHHQKPPPAVTYKECLKNHAASLGGHAVDGCGEFMPSPTATPSDPTSLKCAACGCHRNFHRREPEEPVLIPNATAALEYQPHHRHHPPPPAAPPAHHNSGGHSSPSSPSPPPISSSYYPSAPHMLLALSAGLSAPPVESNMPITPPTATARGGMSGNPNGRKRFRTKFTPNQKERMLQFAERVGWKIQKRDEELIGDFCNEIGVDKSVLKVWMHNNKNNFGRRDQANNTSADTVSGGPPTVARDNGNGLEFTIHYHHNDENNNENKNGIHNHDLSRQSDSVVVATNGSSTSS